MSAPWRSGTRCEHASQRLVTRLHGASHMCGRFDDNSWPPPPVHSLQLPQDINLSYFDAEGNMQETTVGALTKGKKVRCRSRHAPWVLE